MRTDDGRTTAVVGTGGVPGVADVRLVRAGRTYRRAVRPAFVEPDVAPGRGPTGPEGGSARGREAGAVHVVNRPARLPTSPLWPMELRADLTAGALVSIGVEI